MKHSKRYAVVFNKWGLTKSVETITEFDTKNEVDDEVKLIEEMYADTPRPEHKWNSKSLSTLTSDYKWSSPLEAFWGYLVVDFQEEKIIKWGHDNLQSYNRFTDIRKVKDWLFRGEREIPKDYKWKVGEYEGWLQYRWGNGLNALKYGKDAIIDGMYKPQTCTKHCKPHKKKNYSSKPYDENEEINLDKLNSEILENTDAKEYINE